jgi:2-(1,2-epoxy-1,2-dihydrophenyl)acetyl-CoA isomerase
MECNDLLLDKEDHIAVLTLNRPDKLNAISGEMREFLPLALQEVQNDEEMRVLIITGAGRGFCSGADVSVQAARAAGKQEVTNRNAALELVGDFVLAFEKINKPVIAAINGVVAGVGLTMTLLCDIRVASSDARFSAIWVKRGLIPDGGATFLLPMVVGLDTALQLTYTGEIIDAREAEKIKLVSSVVPGDELMSAAKKLADQIAGMPPITVEMAKKLMWDEIRMKVRQYLIYESYGQNVCRSTQDQKEAVKAFMEKREPQFKGL